MGYPSGMTDSTNKSASTMAESAGIGAGVGALGGGLVTLLRDNPSLLKALRNSLAGAAGGAAVGAGVHGARNRQSSPKSPAAPAPAEPPKAEPAPDPPRQMNLGAAALSGLIPIVGPTAHGAAVGGAQQALGSGLLSTAPAALVHSLAQTSSPMQQSGRTAALSLLASALGATGAAHLGNKSREAAAAGE